MSLETATYVDSLVVSNPDGTDQRSTADDHLRLIKACLKRTFPLIAGGASASHVAIGYVNDLTASAQAQLNALRQGPATANFAVQASTASYALAGGHVHSASYAISAGYAESASFAAFAGHASSASAAVLAGHANSASFATLAGDSNELGGILASVYAKLNAAQSWSAGQAITQINSSGTTLTPNADNGAMFRHQMTASVGMTINNPINASSGQVISIHLINAGNSTASWGSAYKFTGGIDPTLSTSSGRVDVFAFQYDSTSAHWRQAGIGVF